MDKAKFNREHVCYADFEASTDGDIHKAYCICYNLDGIDNYYYGHNCAINFLKAMPTNTLIYFHNLSYDITFLINHLTIIYSNPIIKNGRTYSLMAKVNFDHELKTLLFKDSYAIIPHPLRKFPIMFGLDSGHKEVFPYNYYTSDKTNCMFGDINEALQFVKEEDKESFIQNVNEIATQGAKIGEFNMRDYAVFYCKQDVNILYKGFEWFRQSLLKEFNLDVYEFISISSIANRYMEMNCYWLNNNLYDLANTPREFISRCITGGRCMLRDNKKCYSDHDIVDFDAVSLYPSAMARLYCLEGIPKVIPNEWLNTSYLTSHLFEDDQLEPDPKHFISGFFVEISIERINIPRHFPLIVYNPDFNNSKADNFERSCNKCCKMYVDHITYQDLLKYQGCMIRPIRGYYYDGKRDIKIREVIKSLFQLRLRYKREGNPLQEVIKLLLNSIYGKTILKPINTKYKFIRKNELAQYINNRYNYIEEISREENSRTFCLAKELKAYNKHFTFVPLGVNILSMSKRIMNELICTAEDINVVPYYQDTDSIHIHKDDLNKLATQFEAIYSRPLIGKDLGQFHSDFATFGDSNNMPTAIRSIFVGKKSYVDMLQNDLGQIAFHCRCKGIIPDVLVMKANELFPNAKQCIYQDGLVYPSYDVQIGDGDYSIMLLYQKLYNGDEVEFDLCTSKLKPCFQVDTFEISTKETFIRKLQFI